MKSAVIIIISELVTINKSGVIGAGTYLLQIRPIIVIKLNFFRGPMYHAQKWVVTSAALAIFVEPPSVDVSIPHQGQGVPIPTGYLARLLGNECLHQHGRGLLLSVRIVNA